MENLSLLLQVGYLTALSNREALLPYEFDRPIALRIDKETHTLAHELLESFALQLLALSKQPSYLTLFDTTPGWQFSQIKQRRSQTPSATESMFNRMP